MVLALSVVFVVLMAPLSVNAAPLFFTLARPSSKGRFIQLDIDFAAKAPVLHGCQTSARDKRCTRKRTRIPLTPSQLQTLRQLWPLASTTRCARKGPHEKKHVVHRRRTEGQLWVAAGAKQPTTILPPRHDHLSLRPACQALARFGWFLLRRYDRLPLAPPMRPESKDRLCQRDKDCAIAWRPCDYRQPPCGDAWKQAVNLDANRRARKRWANKVPHCETSPRCPGSVAGQWLGNKARCIAKQCTIR